MKSITVPRKKRGRPATGQIPHVTTRLPAAVLEALDGYVKAGKAETRTEAIRRILTEFLTRRGYMKVAIATLAAGLCVLSARLEAKELQSTGRSDALRLGGSYLPR